MRSTSAAACSLTCSDALATPGEVTRLRVEVKVARITLPSRAPVGRSSVARSRRRNLGTCTSCCRQSRVPGPQCAPFKCGISRTGGELNTRTHARTHCAASFSFSTMYSSLTARYTPVFENTYFMFFFSDFKKNDFLRFFEMTYQKVVKSL